MDNKKVDYDPIMAPSPEDTIRFGGDEESKPKKQKTKVAVVKPKHEDEESVDVVINENGEEEILTITVDPSFLRKLVNDAVTDQPEPELVDKFIDAMLELRDTVDVFTEEIMPTVVKQVIEMDDDMDDDDMDDDDMEFKKVDEMDYDMDYDDLSDEEVEELMESVKYIKKVIRD